MEKYNIIGRPGVFSIIETDNNSTTEYLIDNELFIEQMVDYSIVDRLSEIENLSLWMIGTKSQSDQDLMETDRDELKDIEDDYVFSSINTNEYVSKTNDEVLFNEICKTIIDKNSEYLHSLNVKKN